MDRANHPSAFHIIFPLQTAPGIVHGIFLHFDFKQLVGRSIFRLFCSLVDTHIGLQNFVFLFALTVYCNETSGLRMS